MNFFNFDLKKIFTIAALIAVPMLTISLQQHSQEQPWIFRPFYFLAGLTQNTYASFSSGVRGTTGMYLNLIDIKKDNIRLSEELAELKAQLGAMTELKLENERLSHLLDFKQKTNMTLLAARIIGRDLLTDYNTVTINKGEENGIKKWMGTLTISGVVGYIIEVEKTTSKILLITDRYAVVDGLVQRSRARGIVQGHGDTCTLSFLKRSDDVQEGDVVVTSGLDNYFPKGFPIGKVVSVVKDQYGLGQEAAIQPSVNSANLEEIFVVINSKSVDFEAPAEQKGN